VLSSSFPALFMARIHHVAMYLGIAETDELPLMINSTNGRSYPGRLGNGHGVYDFSVPKR
jgi:hypothetical protein